MNERDLNLQKYYIDRYRYRELKNFCRQYPDWKRQLAYGLDRRDDKNLPAGIRSSRMPDPTANEAIRRAELSDKCRLVEQAAIAADATMYKHIIQNVAEGVPFEFMRPPCGVNQFYEVRREFFFILNAMKE